MKLLALMFPLLVAAVRPSVYRPDNTLAVVRPDATLSVNDHAALIETFQDEFNKQKADSDCEEIQKGRRIPEIVRCSQGCSSQDVTSKIQKSPRVGAMPCGYKDDAHHLATQKSAGKIGADGHEVETSKEKGTIQGTKNPSGRRRIPIRLAHYSKKDKSWTKPIILDPNTIVYEEED